MLIKKSKHKQTKPYLGYGLSGNKKKEKKRLDVMAYTYKSQSLRRQRSGRSHLKAILAKC
jgi:hypothetical protein